MHEVIQGDCLDALPQLRRRLGATVDAIYIDPPYNARRDLNYTDAEAGRDHAEWTAFMRPRLEEARELLAPTGAIIVAINDVEHAHLRLLLDEVMGEGNYLATITWGSTTVRNGSGLTGGGVDYMLIYARDARAHRKAITWREPKDGVAEMLTAGLRAWDESGHDPHRASKLLRAWLRSPRCPVSGRGLTDYDRFEPETGRLFRATPLNRAGAPVASAVYDVLHPVTQRPVVMHRGGWRYPERKMLELIESGAVHFGPDETTAPYLWRYLEESGDQVPRAVFVTDKAEGAKALAAALGRDGAFDFPKDPAVLARWIQIVTGGKADALVLDFFAGSGSTLEAVMRLNTADDGQRRCILITNDEVFDDVTLPRATALSRGRGEWVTVFRPEGTRSASRVGGAAGSGLRPAAP